MALLNKFKNLFKKLKPKKVEPPEAPMERRMAKSAEAPTRRSVGRRKIGEFHRILKEPHISEKATNLSNEKKYIFKVYSSANKTEVRKAISNLYGVEVKDIKIINIKPKKRILRGIEGRKTGYKKAIVTLKEGHKIELLPH